MNKKWYIVVVTLVVLLVLNLIPNQANKDADTVRATIYYESDSGYLIPVVKQIGYEDGLALSTLKELAAETPEGLYPILVESDILGVAIDGSTAVVSLAENALSADSQLSEYLKVAAIVNTLCALNNVDQVKIDASGELAYGTDISQAMDVFEVNAESMGNALGTQKITLFFEDVDLAYVVPIVRNVDKSSVDAAVRELIKGPKDVASLKNVFPEGSELLTSFIDDDGTVNLNFSQEFADVSKNETIERCAITTLGLTMAQFDNITGMRIFVAGQPFDFGKTTFSTYINEFGG